MQKQLLQNEENNTTNYALKKPCLCHAHASPLHSNYDGGCMSAFNLLNQWVVSFKQVHSHDYA